jgi:Kef-type K+ transport system membrane component KefB
MTLAWAGLKAAAVLALLLFFGQKLMRTWFTIVVKRRSQELFMLNLLLVTWARPGSPSAPACRWRWAPSWPAC